VRTRSGIAVIAALMLLALSGCGGDKEEIDVRSGPLNPGVSMPASSKTPAYSTERTTARGTKGNARNTTSTRQTVTDEMAVTAAIRAARKDGKRVLIAFGSGWCEDCNALKKYMTSADVVGVVKSKYHFVTVDVGKFNRNMKLSKRYGDVVKKGIPALVVLDKSGRVVTTTKNGSFANASKMTAKQVRAFLVRWAG
jgi:thioredoxin 1